MIVKPIRTRIFRAGDSLPRFVNDHLVALHDEDILVVTSKILALAQRRVVMIKNAKEKERWIRKQSRKTIRTPWCYLTEVSGEWCANAGVDESNANGKLILLPKHPEVEAERLRRSLMQKWNLKRLGILITDTRLIPMKRGTAGVPIAVSGFEPLRSYIGEGDLFARPLKMTEANIAQALAAAAVFVMGEGNERCPLSLIRGAGLTFTNRSISLNPLAIDPSHDLYRDAYLHHEAPSEGARKAFAIRGKKAGSRR